MTANLFVFTCLQLKRLTYRHFRQEIVIPFFDKEYFIHKVRLLPNILPDISTWISVHHLYVYM